MSGWQAWQERAQIITLISLEAHALPAFAAQLIYFNLHTRNH
jgi:hypothetical protein